MYTLIGFICNRGIHIYVHMPGRMQRIHLHTNWIHLQGGTPVYITTVNIVKYNIYVAFSGSLVECDGGHIGENNVKSEVNITGSDHHCMKGPTHHDQRQEVGIQLCMRILAP